MNTEYGKVQYLFEAPDLVTIYVYDITDRVVRASIVDNRPYVALIRVDKYNRQYFTLRKHKVYMDELEEVHVI
jgi:c-di-AMP phosphodiesterase-like protein